MGQLSKNCIKCNSIFFKRPTCSLKKWENSKFCSKNCRKEGENRICPICGKEYYAKKCHIDSGIMNYCSVSCSRKGKIPSNFEEMRKKSPIVKGNTLASCHKGKKRPEFSQEWKNNISKGRQESDNIRGENHWNWQNGKTTINRRDRTSMEYKNWRLSVFQRDRFSCIKCGYRSCKPRDIVADHIKPFYFFPELRFDIDNGRTLCRACDKEIAFNYSRDKHLYNKL